jgi:xanthine/uracil/vitamin C permease (AzgA family)
MRPDKFVNLLSAFLVLIAGFYVIFFMPITLSPAAKIIIGLLLLVYFSIRMRYFKKKYGSDKKPGDRSGSIDNKGLDKTAN